MNPRLQQYLDDLGMKNEPQHVRDRVNVAANFMENRMGWSYDKSLEQMKGIDFNSEVKVEKYKPGDSVVRYAEVGEPDLSKPWYAQVGTGPQDLGIDNSNREFRRYRVTQEMECLSSRAKSINVTWNVQPGPNNPITKHNNHTLGGYPNRGGGKQLLMAEPHKNLERAPLLGERKPSLGKTKDAKKPDLKMATANSSHKPRF